MRREITVYSRLPSSSLENANLCILEKDGKRPLIAGYLGFRLRTRMFVLEKRWDMTVYGRLPSSALENAKLCTAYGSLSLCASLLSFPLSLPCVSRLSIVSRTSLRLLFCFPYFAGRFLGAKLTERGISFSL